MRQRDIARSDPKIKVRPKQLSVAPRSWLAAVMTERIVQTFCAPKRMSERDRMCSNHKVTVLAASQGRRCKNTGARSIRPSWWLSFNAKFADSDRFSISLSWMLLAFGNSSNVTAEGGLQDVLAPLLPSRARGFQKKERDVQGCTVCIYEFILQSTEDLAISSDGM